MVLSFLLYGSMRSTQKTTEINKQIQIERKNYIPKTELGHILRMVNTWICITTEHPEGRRKGRSKTTRRKSTVQEQLQLWWNNWASARAAARGRGRWRECIQAKILFCYFIILFRACAPTKFSERYIFFCKATFCWYKETFNFVNISAEMIHLISYYNKEKFYRYIHQEVCMDFKLTFTISEWNTRCQ